MRGRDGERGVEEPRRARTPGFGERLFDDAGVLRRFVNVFLAEEDIRFLDGTDTAVTEGQVLSIVPAVAGG